ncbi:hypothetical protein ABZS83_15785 [Streptomyces sp. NPDC005426]|uniref:hypothetical protein n=1 Tax=Streptomyces sp. NPDC005426 TaxID=3155344 RepID=UPI0033BCFC52
MGGSDGALVSTAPVIRRLEYDGGVLALFWDGPVDATAPPKYVVIVSSGSLDVEKVWAGAETCASLLLDVTPDQVQRARIAMYTVGPLPTYSPKIAIVTDTATVEAFTLLTFELTFPPVHVATHQNASATARVTRNARLLGEDWPDTASAFVYRTPEVGYPEPVVPFIDITGAVAAGPWDLPDRNPLAAVFDAVFDGDPAGRTIAIGARYAYTLVAGDPPVSALLPVVQSTVGAYDDETVPALTRGLDEWTEREQPETEGGAWAFRLSLHSSVDASLRRPVLQLRHLSSALVTTGCRPATERFA